MSLLDRLFDDGMDHAIMNASEPLSPIAWNDDDSSFNKQHEDKAIVSSSTGIDASTDLSASSSFSASSDYIANDVEDYYMEGMTFGIQSDDEYLNLCDTSATTKDLVCHGHSPVVLTCTDEDTVDSDQVSKAENRAREWHHVMRVIDLRPLWVPKQLPPPLKPKQKSPPLFYAVRPHGQTPTMRTRRQFAHFDLKPKEYFPRERYPTKKEQWFAKRREARILAKIQKGVRQ